jgi:hypothetical protein
MPKTVIDYSNTIIYKITCKDANEHDVYVGHTTNFVQRKHAHKQNCINNKSSNYNCKLYEVIRNKGGWNNWKMEIINFFDCKDHYEARKKEQEYFNSLNATLNSIDPMPKPKFKPVVETENNELMDSNNLAANVDSKYSCEFCDYYTSKNSSYVKHLLTDKHKNNGNDNKTSVKDNEKFPKVEQYECECGKIYKYDSGYYRHKKNCLGVNNVISSDEPTDKELILMLIQQNSLLIQQNSELVKNCMSNFVIKDEDFL